MFITSMENAFSLKGKNAIVTGGQKGIGLGITQALVHQGANVAIFARDEAAARDVIADLTSKYDVRIAFYKTDIGNHANVRDSVSRAVADFGYINVLVNNAGIGTAGALLDMDESLSSWFECFDIDLHGAVRMSYFVAKHMRDSGKGGHIINITSNAGEMINAPFLTAYAAAKAALNHFTRCTAAELAPHDIRVNAIAPGFTKSNFTKGMPEEAMKYFGQQVPIGRMAEAVEIGALAAYLASDASDLVTGAVFTADGGFSLQH